MTTRGTKRTFKEHSRYTSLVGGESFVHGMFAQIGGVELRIPLHRATVLELGECGSCGDCCGCVDCEGCPDCVSVEAMPAELQLVEPGSDMVTRPKVDEVAKKLFDNETITLKVATHFHKEDEVKCSGLVCSFLPKLHRHLAAMSPQGPNMNYGVYAIKSGGQMLITRGGQAFHALRWSKNGAACAQSTGGFVMGTDWCVVLDDGGGVAVEECLVKATVDPPVGYAGTWSRRQVRHSTGPGCRPRCCRIAQEALTVDADETLTCISTAFRPTTARLATMRL